MTKAKALYRIVVPAVCVVFAANGGTYYVSTGGSDGADGSAETPFATIAKGVETAAASSEPRKVIIKTGTYAINSAISITSALILESESGNPADVVIDGLGTTPLVRWIGNYDATLSGLTLTNGYCGTGSGAGVLMNGGTITNCVITGCLLTGGGTRAAYGAGIYAGFEEDKLRASIINTHVVGNTVSNSCASGEYQASCGGGIYFPKHGNGVVRGCTVANNVAWFYGANPSATTPTANHSMGGGIATYPYECACLITDCIVRGNMATNASPNGQAGRGGGIAAGAGTVISNCLVYGNIASSQGGGIAINGATVTHCTITNNAIQAAQSEAYSVFGGGVALGAYNGVGSKCLNSRVEANAIRGMTKAYYNNSNIGGGGGVSITGNNGIVANCSVSGNYAHCGGALMTYNSNAVVSNCLISGNSASNAGGVLEYWKPQKVLVTDCVIASNTAATAAVSYGGEVTADCGGLTYRNSYIFSNCTSTANYLFYGHLNAAYCQPLVIDHCTVVSNSATYFIVQAATLGGMTNVFARGCVFFGNTTRNGGKLTMGGPNGASTVLAATTNTWYNFSDNVGGFNADATYGNNTSLATDIFVNAAGGDYRFRRNTAAIGHGGPVEDWMGDGGKRGPLDMGDGTMTIASVGEHGISISRNNAVPRVKGSPEPGCFETWWAPGLMLTIH
ncbi:MAG: hypothetical protein IKJ45_02040 [Kiritimatiellae bacterium]|nr:hypothetical protein [Kiritimatiellia bacterium]